MTSTTDTEDSPARREQREAAEQNLDLFAREAVLALDRYERSFPTGDRDTARKVGERLADLWGRYGLDEVAFDPDASDPQRILVAAAKLATAPDSRGVTIADASQQAARDAHAAETRPVTENIGRLRWQLKESFGDSVEYPPAGEWLDQSLSRLAKASVLRDVVNLGAQVQVSEAARVAAEQFVQQGQDMMADKSAVSTAAASLRQDSKTYAIRQLAYIGGSVGFNAEINSLGLPYWAEVISRIPAAVWMARGVTTAWADRKDLKDEVKTGQQRLRSVRTDLTNTLDNANPPLGERDARAVQNARQPDRGGRGR
jgi:hypothetical protein